MYWNVSHLPITEIWEGGDIHYLQRSSCMLNTITAAGKRRLSRSQGLSRNPLHSRRVLKQVLRNTARSPSRPQPHGPPSYGHSAAERREGASRRCIWEWVCRSLTGVKPGVGPGQSLMPTSDCAAPPRFGVSQQARCASARGSGTEGWHQAALWPRLVPCMQGACSSWGGESAIAPLLRRKAARYVLAEVRLPCWGPTLLGNLFWEICVFCLPCFCWALVFFNCPFLSLVPPPQPLFFFLTGIWGETHPLIQAGTTKKEYSLLTTTWCSRNSLA